MAATSSSMVALGTPAPDFALIDTGTGAIRSRDELKGDRGTVIMFICNHCPYVKHVNVQLVAVASEYQRKGISFVAISSNDTIAYPQDGPEEMKRTAEEQRYPFPYLYDETQAIARAYDAACTPDIFVYGASLRLVYRGQLDDSRPGNHKPVDGASLRSALDALLAGLPVSDKQIPSIGCNIKWKAAG